MVVETELVVSRTQCTGFNWLVCEDFRRLNSRESVNVDDFIYPKLTIGVFVLL